MTASARRWGLIALLACVAGVLWMWALRPDGRLRITFLDVGQGDAIVVETPHGHVAVIDAGPRMHEDDGGRRAVIPFLRHQGVSQIDTLLFSHEDADHVGGGRTLLRRIRVGSIGGPRGAEHHRRIASAISEPARTILLTDLTEGAVIQAGDGVRLSVLRPPAGRSADGESENDTSLVLRVEYGQFAALLTGDMGVPGEEDLLASGVNVQANVLKLGHHGSRASSSDRFLDTVHPSLAVVSAGLRNSYGHPHREVLERLTARRVAVARTDRQGSITVETDGRRMWWRGTR